MPLNRIVQDAYNKTCLTCSGPFSAPGRTWVRYPNGALRLVSSDSLLLL